MGMPANQQCTIALRFDKRCDRRRYNLPTAGTSEIAAILPGSGDVLTHFRDIILHRLDGGLQQISELHPFYPALHYVLLFPTGQLGWHPDLEYKNGQQADNPEDVEQPPPGADGGGGGKKKSADKYVSAFPICKQIDAIIEKKKQKHLLHSSVILCAHCDSAYQKFGNL